MPSSSRINRPRHTTGVGRTTMRPHVQNTFQLYAKIQPNDDVYSSVQKLVRFWLCDKFPRHNFPVESIIGAKPFPDTAPGLSFDSVSISVPQAWAFRLEHPDSTIPGRTWKTEIGLKKSDTSGLFGARVICSSLSDDEVPITCPRIVKDIIAKIGLRDALPISFTPWEVLEERELEHLRNALQDPNRNLPIIMLSEIDKNQEGCGQLGKYALNLNTLSQRLSGLAHIVLLPWNISYKWTNLVGKAWSVYKGAVRTYFPKLDFSKSDPWNHPVVNIERIVFWRHDDLLAEEAFSTFLADSIIRSSATKFSPWREGIFLDEIRSQKTKIEYDALFKGLLENSNIKINESIREIKGKFDQERSILEKKIQDLEDEAEKYNDDAIKSDRELEVAQGKIATLRSKVDALLFQLKEAHATQAENESSLPQSYDELEDWIERQFPESIFLHSRAKRSIGEAEYEDLQKLCQAIELLAGPYRAMRMNLLKKEDFDKLLNDGHFEISISIDRSRAGQEGDAYFVHYNGKRKFIDLHIKNSSARDPKRCLRIYFFWDSESQLVVICWLPGHLPIRST